MGSEMCIRDSPWLWPRMGGIAEERLLGASLPFPGYPELGLTGTSAGVAEMSAVGKLASPGSRLGPWYVESVVGELSAHLGQAWAPGTTPMLDPGVTGTRLAGDLGGRLGILMTLGPARWDVGLRLAMPLSEVRIVDLDGDDRFDIVGERVGSRMELRRPRFYVELGRFAMR